MKTFVSFALCAALLAATSTARAQDSYDVASLMTHNSVVSNSSLSRIETLEAELESLRTEMDMAKGGGGMVSDCDCNFCCCCGDGCHHLYFEYEQTFFQYKRADGARVTTAVPNSNADFDLQASPRMTLGWMLPCGPGFRVRYWNFDHAMSVASGAPAIATVKAYTIDVELYDTFRLNRCWTGEVSMGYRHSSFREYLQDNRVPAKFCGADFDGGGGVFGLELRRCLPLGTLYGRARGSILCGNKEIFTNDVPGVATFVQRTENTDVIAGQFEIGIGWEVARTVLSNKTAYFRIGAEWQNWYNYSIEFDNQAANNDGIDGNADAGFIGFIIGAGIIL